jgi:CHASE3 domain sensor protein
MSTLKKPSNLIRAWWTARTTSARGMHLSRPSDLVWGVCLFFCLLVVTAVAQYRQTAQMFDDAHLVIHAHEFVEALDGLLLTVRQAETGHTYYLMTGDDRYLKSYAAGIAATKEKIAEIKQLAENSLEERNRIPRLQAALKGELGQLSASVWFRKEIGLDAAQAIVLAGQETKAMDALEAEVEGLERYEQNLLDSEEQLSASDYRWALLTIMASALVALLAFGALVWWLIRYLNAKHASTFSMAGEGVIEDVSSPAK